MAACVTRTCWGFTSPSETTVDDGTPAGMYFLATSTVVCAGATGALVCLVMRHEQVDQDGCEHRGNHRDQHLSPAVRDLAGAARAEPAGVSFGFHYKFSIPVPCFQLSARSGPNLTARQRSCIEAPRTPNRGPHCVRAPKPDQIGRSPRQPETPRPDVRFASVAHRREKHDLTDRPLSREDHRHAIDPEADATGRRHSVLERLDDTPRRRAAPHHRRWPQVHAAPRTGLAGHRGR